MPDELTTAQRAPAPAAVDVAERIAALRHAAEEWGATTHERWLDRLDAAERALCDEVDRLRAEVAALRVDKARLTETCELLRWASYRHHEVAWWTLAQLRRDYADCGPVFNIDAARAAQEGR